MVRLRVCALPLQLRMRQSHHPATDISRDHTLTDLSGRGHVRVHREQHLCRTHPTLDLVA